MNNFNMYESLQLLDYLVLLKEFNMIYYPMQGSVFLYFYEYQKFSK
jgi:hypothetical protein